MAPDHASVVVDDGVEVVHRLLLLLQVVLLTDTGLAQVQVPGTTPPALSVSGADTVWGRGWGCVPDRGVCVYLTGVCVCVCVCVWT